MLRIHDSAAREKVEFVPRHDGAVSIYVCGVTPYDSPHLGHGRTAIAFDTIRRYLEWRGFRVTFVSNVTDVEDRIIARAAERGTTEPELAREFEAEYWNQLRRLNVRAPDAVPRATEFIDQMLRLIGELVAAGRAYVIEGQGVYFEVAKFADYGSLSHRTPADLLESAGRSDRVAVDERKRSPVDFALWKAAKPGEPQWDSPWGGGRPGWHIECSAMSLEILGEGFDIHGGGDDLLFPHNENELAQAAGAGHAFARHWLHAGMVNVDGEKMSKSLGNFTTLEELLDRWDPRAFRLLVLQTHYRRQMEFTAKELDDADKALGRIDQLVRRARIAGIEPADSGDSTPFRDAMDDDFDTPAALAFIFDTVREANTAIDQERADAAQLVATVVELTRALGIELRNETDEPDADIQALVEQRDAARAAKDFAESDRIRDELRERGVVLEDTSGGTVWRRDP
ncbi:MAG: cysteine--tRNA ligase [Actinomycetota bacterium]|nr:cysteine--tRNA ligase [Actinomycetota bacterium]